MKPPATVLLTGATGHLGAAVAAAVLAATEGPRLRLFVRSEDKLRRLADLDRGLRGLLHCPRVTGDIRDPVAIEEALDGVDAVVHTCHSHEYWRGARYLHDVNVHGAAALAGAISRRKQIRRVVFIGSYSAPWDENTEPVTCDVDAISARECSSRAKRLAQSIFLRAAADAGFRLDIVSPGYMIGPYQIEPTYFGALFHAVILRPIRWAPPNAINLVDVRDVARAVVRCLDDGSATALRVMASGDNMSLQRLFAEMNRQAGFDTSPRVIPPTLFRLMPRLRQFGRFGQRYFTTDHTVDHPGLEDRTYGIPESVRDSIGWAQRQRLYASRREFVKWMAARYLA